MEHVHIAIVGGQTYPVYLAIKVLNPTKVVLMHSAQTETDANNIIEVLVDEGVLSQDQFEKVCLSTTKMDAIYNKIADSVAWINDGIPCSVNLTGGTKLWSIFLYKYFQNRSYTDFYYVDQNCRLYNIETLQKHDADVQLNAKTIFKLYGSPVKSYTPFEEYTKEDFEVIKKTEALRGKGAFIPAYNSVGNPSAKNEVNKIKNQRKGIIQSGNSYAEWDKNENSVEVCLYSKKGLHHFETLKSPHAIQLFFFCHWFELKVAKILSQWEQAKEVWLNVEFPYKNNNPKNEIDIVVNTGKRLLFVECKTQILDKTNIDKFSKAVKNYSGMASKALFVSLAPTDDITREKCEQNDVMCFDLNSQSTEKLFKMLNQSLTELNKK